HLALAAVPHFTNFGPVIYAGYMEKTFRSWLASMLAYLKDYTDGHVGELIEEPDSGKAIFRLNTTAHTFSLRQAIEMQMAGLRMLVQQVIPQGEVKPDVVRFRHPKPESTKLHQSIFNAPIEFGCEHDEIEFKREWLNIRLKGRGYFLKPLVNLYMSQRLKNTPQFVTSISETVAVFVKCMLGTGRCTLPETANALSIQDKKLQRMLDEEGTNFSKVLDKVRYEEALVMIKSPDLKIKTIASMLDYSNNAAFTLAFNRWTGMSPAAYRKMLAEKNEMNKPL
ncbi:MAG: AraC family transcriptional regulator ligand-binding domain-containing protein, partial [Salaquimonas sp.]